MSFIEDESDEDKAVRFQNCIIAAATNGGMDDAEYRELRRHFLEHHEYRQKLPAFVRRCSDLGQFWGFIKHERGTYAERRTLIWNAFRPLIAYIETEARSPGVQAVTATLEKFDAEHVQRAWNRALERRATDPEGAITAARTLLETVCKHVLDDAKSPYDPNADLPALWRLAASELNLAPQQHQEEVFKQILGGCQSIVNGLGTLRNRVGDAHGQGRKSIRPKARHAELAVNLAGAMASFLTATRDERQKSP